MADRTGFFGRLFALLSLGTAVIGFKLPTLILNFFYPIALIYFVFALRHVYKQKWAMTVLKAVVLFACETLLCHRSEHRRVRDCIHVYVDILGFNPLII